MRSSVSISASNRGTRKERTKKMNVITPEGSHYSFDFRYGYDWSPHPDFAGIRVAVTYCRIYYHPVGEDAELVVEEYAHCSPVEQFKKEQGRKVALTRALFEAFPDDGLDKDCRAAFWAVYLNRKNVSLPQTEETF
jgi:hypothetical protein